LLSFQDFSPAQLWLIAIWLAALGGCVGSFLNVVVYRLPAGKSLVHPSSHCPLCGHPIRWYDNVPVFGWFMLRGKCRDCKAPIALRYPAVEALTAAIFFGLAWVELFSDGANLPLRGIPGSGLPVIILPRTLSQVIAIYSFHMLLLCTLLPAALISYDRQRVSVSLYAPALFVGFVATMFYPWLRPVPRSLIYDSPLLESVAGCGVGLAAGLVLSRIVPRRTPFDDAASLYLAMASTGLFLGYQAILVLGVAVVLLGMIERATQKIRPGIPVLGPIIWLAMLAPVWICLWKMLPFWYSSGQIGSL
jgi:leader peptidase (prepilin peptidase)/N-methyltransferase